MDFYHLYTIQSLGCWSCLKAKYKKAVNQFQTQININPIYLLIILPEQIAREFSRPCKSRIEVLNTFLVSKIQIRKIVLHSIKRKASGN